MDHRPLRRIENREPVTFPHLDIERGRKLYVITLHGVSHVSEESIREVDRALDTDPEIMALELDALRLNSLLSDKNTSSGPLKLRAVSWIQRKIGEKTGFMPGTEMKYAYRKAKERDLEVALIDRDIRATLSRLKEVRHREKAKALLSLPVAFFSDRGMDPSEIPEQEFIDEALGQFESKLPGMYRVLMEERNRWMAEALSQLADQETDKDIAAVIGAAHVKPVKNTLEEQGYEVYSQKQLERN